MKWNRWVNHGYSQSQQQVLKGLHLCQLTSCVLPIDPFNPTIYESNNALKLVMKFPKIDKQYGLLNNYCSIFSVSRVSLEYVKLFWIIREAFTST